MPMGAYVIAMIPPLRIPSFELSMSSCKYSILPLLERAKTRD